MLLLSLFSRIKKNEPFMDTTYVKYSLHNERVTLEQVSHLALVGGFKDDQDAAIISKRSAHHHYAILEQRIHERRVLCPVRLFPTGFACYPVGTGTHPPPPEAGGALRGPHQCFLPPWVILLLSSTPLM